MTTLAIGLTGIVNDVWSALLSLPIARVEGPPADITDPAEPMMTCTVPIEGAWTGAVVVTCSTGLAERIAEAMLGVSGISPADVRDALGEVVNVVAGNAKTLLPQPSRMSLPVVTQGTEYSAGAVPVPVVARLAFECEGHVFTVTALGSVREQELA